MQGGWWSGESYNGGELQAQCLISNASACGWRGQQPSLIAKAPILQNITYPLENPVEYWMGDQYWGGIEPRKVLPCFTTVWTCLKPLSIVWCGRCRQTEWWHVVTAGIHCAWWRLVRWLGYSAELDLCAQLHRFQAHPAHWSRWMYHLGETLSATRLYIGQVFRPPKLTEILSTSSIQWHSDTCQVFSQYLRHWLRNIVSPFWPTGICATRCLDVGSSDFIRLPPGCRTSIGKLITRNGTYLCPIPSGGFIGWVSDGFGSFCLAKRSLFCDSLPSSEIYLNMIKTYTHRIHVWYIC